MNELKQEEAHNEHHNSSPDSPAASGYSLFAIRTPHRDLDTGYPRADYDDDAWRIDGH